MNVVKLGIVLNVKFTNHRTIFVFYNHTRLRLIREPVEKMAGQRLNLIEWCFSILKLFWTRIIHTYQYVFALPFFVQSAKIMIKMLILTTTKSKVHVARIVVKGTK